MLKMEIKNIRKNMGSDINCNNWNHPRSTNCYAFSLGLNVPEREICNCAYIPGNIAHQVIGTEKYDIENSDELIKAFLNDLLALGLRYEEVDYLDKVPRLRVEYESDDSWDILLFIEDQEKMFRDFHFVKVGKDGKLYHKRGWSCKPSKTTVEDVNSYGYSFVKRYHVTLDRNNGKY